MIPSTPYLNASFANIAFVEKHTAPKKTSVIPLMYVDWFFRNLFFLQGKNVIYFMLFTAFNKLSN
ncbi:MAG TPA: hypothetical protein PK431_09675 [Chitinophagales bacterium]|nr:hypothetical protein [Chitinophagales bacterium]